MRKPDTQGYSTLCLADVAYCPNFHVNIVSFPCFHEQKLYWNTEFGLLYHAGQNVAQVERHDNLFIIREGISQSVNAVRHSSKPLISEVPANTWHCQLGHMYHGSMAKLPHMVDGVAITDSQNKGHDCCHTCELSKAKSQISHHPAQHTKQPGE